MRRLPLLVMLLLVGSGAFAFGPHQAPFEVRVSDEEEVFVDQVKGWNGFNGEVVTLNIYRTKTYDGEVLYVARKVYEWGESVSGVVCPEDPEEANGYTYSAKVGFIGRYYFNSHKIPRRYQPPQGYY